MAAFEFQRLIFLPGHRNDVSECVEQCESGKAKMQKQTQRSQQRENNSDNETNAKTLDARRPAQC